MKKKCLTKQQYGHARHMSEVAGSFALEVQSPPESPNTTTGNSTTDERTNKYSTDDVARIRAELEALVCDESIGKEVALQIMRLHHRMESCIVNIQTIHLREIDRLHNSLDQSSLKSEVDSLTMRQTIKDNEIEHLRAENEQLQQLAVATPRGRR